MRMLSLAFVLLALAGATACGAGKPKPLETPAKVAALLRDKWGSIVSPMNILQRLRERRAEKKQDCEAIALCPSFRRGSPLK